MSKKVHIMLTRGEAERLKDLAKSGGLDRSAFVKANAMSLLKNTGESLTWLNENASLGAELSKEKRYTISGVSTSLYDTLVDIKKQGGRDPKWSLKVVARHLLKEGVTEE